MNALIKQNPRIIALVQARMGSTRLPQKALMKILDKTLIEWIFYRLSFAKEINGIALSTSDTPENDILAEHARNIGLQCFRGSETALIKRHLEAARMYNADAIVRITGDNPLVDPAIVDKLVKFFKDNDTTDLVTNVFPPTFPDGMDIEVMSIRTLERLDKEFQNALDREWFIAAMMEKKDAFSILNLSYKDNLVGLRLTVDYPEDLALVEKIFSKLHRENEVFHLEDMLSLFKREPTLLSINKKWVDTTLINNSRLKTFYELKKNTH